MRWGGDYVFYRILHMTCTLNILSLKIQWPACKIIHSVYLKMQPLSHLWLLAAPQFGGKTSPQKSTYEIKCVTLFSTDPVTRSRDWFSARICGRKVHQELRVCLFILVLRIIQLTWQGSFSAWTCFLLQYLQDFSHSILVHINLCVKLPGPQDAAYIFHKMWSQNYLIWVYE